MIYISTLIKKSKLIDKDINFHKLTKISKLRIVQILILKSIDKNINFHKLTKISKLRII